MVLWKKEQCCRENICFRQLWLLEALECNIKCCNLELAGKLLLGASQNTIRRYFRAEKWLETSISFSL